MLDIRILVYSAVLSWLVLAALEKEFPCVLWPMLPQALASPISTSSFATLKSCSFLRTIFFFSCPAVLGTWRYPDDIFLCQCLTVTGKICWCKVAHGIKSKFKWIETKSLLWYSQFLTNVTEKKTSNFTVMQGCVTIDHYKSTPPLWCCRSPDKVHAAFTHLC